MSDTDELFRLEDILRHVYAGRADVAMIDELIEWLKIRREAVQVKVCPMCGLPCGDMPMHILCDPICR